MDGVPPWCMCVQRTRWSMRAVPVCIKCTNASLLRKSSGIAEPAGGSSLPRRKNIGLVSGLLFIDGNVLSGMRSTLVELRGRGIAEVRGSDRRWMMVWLLQTPPKRTTVVVLSRCEMAAFVMGMEAREILVGTVVTMCHVGTRRLYCIV